MAIEIYCERPDTKIITARDQGKIMGSMRYSLDRDKHIWELKSMTARKGAGIDLFRAFVQDIGSGARVHADIINIKTVNSIEDLIDGDASIADPTRLSAEQSMRIPMVRGASALGFLVDEVLVYPGSIELFGHTR